MRSPMPQAAFYGDWGVSPTSRKSLSCHAKTFVLLKNEKNLLPLEEKGKIAFEFPQANTIMSFVSEGVGITITFSTVYREAKCTTTMQHLHRCLAAYGFHRNSSAI